MKALKKTLIIASIVAGTAAAGAQNTNSGYFLDNYTYRFEMNPAFGNDRGFVSMPALGNMNIAMKGNLNLSSIFYARNGKTVLFTNPDVSVADAMSKFKDSNKLGVGTKFDILTVGFKAFGGYNTVSLNARANVNMSLPGSFFSLAKEGITNKTYDIRDLRARATAFASLALNHSRDIKQLPGLRVGASMKFLVGVADVDVRLNEADLTLGTDEWTARTNADIYGSLEGLKFKKKLYTPKGPDGGAPREYVNGLEVDGFGPVNGFGLAFDLGAEYKWQDFKFSAAVLDLGFINWKKTQWASTDGTQTITTDAYTFNADGSATNSFDNELDRLKDNASKLYQLKDMGELGSRTRALAATLNFGVDYALPVYRKLHFGLMNSTYLNGPYTSTEFRLSANVAPVKIFSADVNMVAGTYGVGFGWLLNLHAPGINLFVGMDRMVGKLSKDMLPLNSNASFNFGLNFPF